MKRRHKRLAFVVAGIGGLGAATALVLNAMNQNLVFAFSPSDVAAKEAPQGDIFRLGGLVQEGSVQRQEDSLQVRFVVTDTAKHIPVVYEGILPDLFEEGEGVVAQGRLKEGVFYAKEVLAKHDENYMPAEAADALKKAERAKAQGAGANKGGMN